jgi:hypothetical protein
MYFAARGLFRYKSMLHMDSTIPLAELERQFADIKAGAARLAEGLKESQFNWRPASQRWSIAECLLHLNIVGERYVRMIETAIEEARAKNITGKGPFEYGFAGKCILEMTEPPPKRKFKAARSLTPAYGQPLNAVMPTFFHLQDQLEIERARGLDLARIKIPVPGLGLARLNLYAIFAWVAAHERRHLWQARQVRNEGAFPAGTSVPHDSFRN